MTAQQNPKFKREDNVLIHINEDWLEGTVLVVDANGTFDTPGTIFYDVLAKDKNGKECLYKHVEEELVKKS